MSWAGLVCKAYVLQIPETWTQINGYNQKRSIKTTSTLSSNYFFSADHIFVVSYVCVIWLTKFGLNMHSQELDLFSCLPGHFTSSMDKTIFSCVQFSVSSEPSTFSIAMWSRHSLADIAIPVKNKVYIHLKAKDGHSVSCWEQKYINLTVFWLKPHFKDCCGFVFQWMKAVLTVLLSTTTKLRGSLG